MNDYKQYQLDFSYDQEFDESKLKSNHKKSQSDCFSNLNTSSEIQKKEYNIFQNLIIPKDFFKKIKGTKEILNDQQKETQKKISYYFSEEMIKESQSQKKSSFQNIDENKPISQQRISDTTINKILEDFEYIQLKENQQFMEFQKVRHSADSISGIYQNNIQNNIIESVNSFQNLNQNQISIQQNNISQQLQKNSNFQACQDQDCNRYTGYLKFFDEVKNYGFIGYISQILVKEDDQSDVFVHYDDLQKANLNKAQLKNFKTNQILRFQFNILNYIGKHSHSRKAIELVVLKQNNLENKQPYKNHLNQQI